MQAASAKIPALPVGRQHSELSAMLAGEKSIEGEEKWEGRGGSRGRETRRRADKGPREAMPGRMIETWGRNRG